MRKFRTLSIEWWNHITLEQKKLYAEYHKPRWTFGMVDKSDLAIEQIYKHEVHNKLTKSKKKRFKRFSFITYKDIGEMSENDLTSYKKQLKVYLKALKKHKKKYISKIVVNDFKIKTHSNLFCVKERMDYPTYFRIDDEISKITNQLKNKL